MIPIQAMKFVRLCGPELKDNGAFTANGYVDLQGWGHLRILFVLGDIDIGFGSTLASTPPLVEESDATGSGYTAVTSAALSACPGADDDGKLYAIDVDLCKSHKRYMRVQAPTAGDGTAGVNACIIAILSRGAQSPISAAEAGLAELITA